jgi:hypothetical protein
MLLTVLSIWEAYGIHRSDNAVVNMQFHQLLGGLFLINGVIVFAGIPFLFHNKAFNEQVI